MSLDPAAVRQNKLPNCGDKTNKSILVSVGYLLLVVTPQEYYLPPSLLLSNHTFSCDLWVICVEIASVNEYEAHHLLVVAPISATFLQVEFYPKCRNLLLNQQVNNPTSDKSGRTNR